MSDLQKIPVYLSSSIFSSILTHPIDVLKVRVQTSKLTNDSFQIISDAVKKNNKRFLFKGICASFLRNGSFVTTKMFTYDYLRNIFTTNSFTDKVLSGIGAGICGSIVGTPFDLVMVRIQNDPKKFPNVYTTVYKTLKNEGFFSLWNGMYYTMNRAIIVTACQFSVFEQLKYELNQLHINKYSSFITSSILSSTITGILSNPLDLCKSRRMNNCINSSIIKIIKNEGTWSLWKGLQINLARQIPLNLIRFTSLEFFKQFTST